jgi:hypothetical protein
VAEGTLRQGNCIGRVAGWSGSSRCLGPVDRKGGVRPELSGGRDAQTRFFGQTVDPTAEMAGGLSRSSGSREPASDLRVRPERTPAPRMLGATCRGVRAGFPCAIVRGSVDDGNPKGRRQAAGWEAPETLDRCSKVGIESQASLITQRDATKARIASRKSEKARQCFKNCARLQGFADRSEVG